MRFALTATCCLLLASCGPKDYPATEVHTNRYEQSMSKVNVAQLQTDITNLRQEDPAFFRIYVEDIMGIGPISDTLPIYLTMLERYLGNKAIQGLYKEVEQKYPDLSFYEKGMGIGFHRLKEAWPSIELPKLYSFISEFYYAAITYDTSVVAVGLDMYMGSDYKYYPAVNKPIYQIRKLRKEYMVPNAMTSYLNARFPLTDQEERCIDKLVYEGKIMYLLDHVLPQVEDTLLLGYTKEQLEWCKASEASIWAFFVDKDLLFSTNNVEFFRYFTDGPNTSGMPPESPGNISKWLGWQIVNEYMDASGSSIQDLMRTQDGQAILDKAGYRPK